MRVMGQDISDAKVAIVRDRMKAANFTPGALAHVALAFLTHLPAHKAMPTAQRMADAMIQNELGRCNIRQIDPNTWTWIGPRD